MHDTNEKIGFVSRGSSHSLAGSTGPSPISLLDADFCAARSGLHSEDDDIRKKKKKNEKERNNAIYKQLKRQTTSTNRC